MLDNALITLVISTIIAQEAVIGFSGLPIAQAFQPTQQGVNTQPTAYLYKVGDVRRGTPSRTDVWDPINEVMVHTETQIYETTLQFSALSTQNPADQTQKTASDILNLIAYILQSSATIQELLDNDVGVLRIGDVRNPYFTDDRQRNEAAPSLDVILTHKQIVSTENSVVQSVDFRILTV